MKTHHPSPWVRFFDRLPTRIDADTQGKIIARLVSAAGGEVIERVCDWDWIPPHRAEALSTWLTNGFIDWKPTQEPSKAPQPTHPVEE